MIVVIIIIIIIIIIIVVVIITIIIIIIVVVVVFSLFQKPRGFLRHSEAWFSRVRLKRERLRASVPHLP